MPARRLATALVLTAVAGATGAGCGEQAVSVGGPSVAVTMPVPPSAPGEVLTKKQAFTVNVAVERAERCNDLRLRTPIEGFVDDLVALAERHPDAIGSAFGEPATTPRDGLRRMVEALERNACRPELVQRLRTTQQALPPAP